jgi:hypothetical protein
MLMKRAYFFFTLLFISIATSAWAQPETETDEPGAYRPPFVDRLVVGGGLGLQFGNFTFIDVSPMVGYKVLDRLIFGVGGTYRYYRERDPQSTTTLRANIVGGSVWGRGFILENLYVHAEYEALRMEIIGGTNRRGIRMNYALVGPGYTQQFGPRASSFVSFLFPVYSRSTIPNYSIYRIPVIRFGFMFDIGGNQ